MAAGLVLWAFAILIPSIHLQLGFTSSLGITAFLPIAVLLFATLTGNRVASIAAFVPSLLPALIIHPSLVGPRVYGPGAFLALSGATLVYFAVALSWPAAQSLPAAPQAKRRSRLGVRALLSHTAAHGVIFCALMYAAYFHRSFRELVSKSYAGYSEQATVAIGLAVFGVWGILVSRHLVFRLGGSVLARREHRAEWNRFLAESTDIHRLRPSLAWAMVVGALSTGMLLAVLLLDK